MALQFANISEVSFFLYYKVLVNFVYLKKITAELIQSI